jgi:cytochrome c-type biogenesis protein CcmF
MTGGKIGELFVALAFSGALTSMISFWMASLGRERAAWERLGFWAFLTHAASILGIAGTMFYLILTHQYQYFYVWDHSSDELPLHFVISCFWEGQEGSFLLWCFWHSVLGMFPLFTRNEWRAPVMGILSSIEVILSSMLLGIYVPEAGVWLIYGLLIAGPALYLGWRYLRQRDALPLGGAFHLGGLMTALLLAILLLRGQAGFGAQFFGFARWFEGGSFRPDAFIFWLASAAVLGYLLLYAAYLRGSARLQRWDMGELAAGLALGALAFTSLYLAPDAWKIGSTPFLSLRAAFPNDPIWLENPNFVPDNGDGLNPLLQNYWMVIHPPTLFLGFAATALPFAYVMAGLFRRQYSEWIKPALPWMSFSVMILGIGIIMGGYWAYETLSFGGYWNWDPVENSSFVPWLCGVASLHAMLIYRRTKGYLHMTQLLIISVFMLVLYSTFLTRSGILGDTSVHTFTDLGLSGQLMVLVGIYLALVAVTLALRWREIPRREDENGVWSAEFMLFLGILVFTFAGLIITLATSLPVFNTIWGLNLALPARVQLFYYQGTVWFAIAFGVLSGLGQFLWWKIGRQKSVADALFRPFLAAVVLGSALLIILRLSQMNFGWDSIFNQEVEAASGLAKAGAWVKYAFIGLADEILLYASLFGLVANLDVLISLLGKNRKGLKVMGGTVVHIGFALMLLGMLFSSGYDEVITKNLTPADLAQFPEQEQMDNVLIPRNFEYPIKGFSVSYTGKKEAEAPVRDLVILDEGPAEFTVAFYDKNGDRYVSSQPRMPFLKEGAEGQPVQPVNDPGSKAVSGIDMERLERMLNQDLAAFAPRLINNRTEYGLTFRSQKDPEKSFTLYPEAELNEEMGSLLAHPSRKIFWNRDIYVYTSSLPDPKASEPRFASFELGIGDTAQLGSVVLQLQGLRNMSGQPGLEQYDLAAAAQLMAYHRSDSFSLAPVFVIRDKSPGMISDLSREAGVEVAFIGVDPARNIMQFQARFQDPDQDFVVIKAISKPFINLLWLGTFVLTAGFLISIFRRVQEMRAK